MKSMTKYENKVFGRTKNFLIIGCLKKSVKKVLVMSSFVLKDEEKVLSILCGTLNKIEIKLNRLN